MTEALGIVGQAIAILILLALTEAAKKQYIADNPGQPGWPIYLIGYVAIMVLLIV